MNGRGVACAIPLALASACFSPTYDEVRCDLTRACPDGLTCDVDGACRDELLATDARTLDGFTIDASIDAVAVDAPIDAFMLDAPMGCPLGYTSGYRYIAAVQSWRAAEADCENDSSGRTHLIVINDQAELAAINAAISTDLWVGVVRNPAPDRSSWQWRAVTGGPATFLPWEAGQPDNASGNQLVVSLIDASGLLRDVDISSTRAALCECDGLPPIDANYVDP